MDLDIVLRSDHGRVIHEFVAAGLGVALMPLLAVNPHDPRTNVIDLGGPHPAEGDRHRLAHGTHDDRCRGGFRRARRRDGLSGAR